MKKKVQLLVRTGKRYGSPSFRVYFKSSGNYKIGFIAGRKIGTPSKRNYLKRTIREFWRKNFTSGDSLFILKPSALSREKNEIVRELENAAEKIRCKDF